jgi:aspartate aminotransferase-like enzyme
MMGESCVPANVFALLNALEKILPDHGYEVANGVAAAAASAQLAENPSPVYTS